LFLASIDTIVNNKNALIKPKSEKALKKPREGIELPATVGGRDRESKFIGSKDLDISEISHLKNSKDLLPLVKHVTIATKIDEEERSQRESDKLAQAQAENINTTELSKKVLLKCNIIRPKRDGIPTLNKGDGHLMSMSEKNLRQVYQDVYQKAYL